MESNNNFEDLYDVLEVHMGSSTKEIVRQYKLKLEPFNNKIKNGIRLGEEELWEVKLLKIAKYVLTTKHLKEKYDFSRVMSITEDENEETSVHESNNQTSEKSPNINKYYDKKKLSSHGLLYLFLLENHHMGLDRPLFPQESRIGSRITTNFKSFETPS